MLSLLNTRYGEMVVKYTTTFMAVKELADKIRKPDNEVTVIIDESGVGKKSRTK